MMLIWCLNGFSNPIVLAVVIITQVVWQRRGFHLNQMVELHISQAFEQAQMHFILIKIPIVLF
jgi:hypothetical protein